MNISYFPNLSFQRYQELTENKEAKLTEEEAKYWHFCPDWDFLLIHIEDLEISCCNCERYKEWSLKKQQNS